MTTRGDRTRAKLIKATLSVVAEVGYAKTSTRAIATKAKVAEGTLYRHFPDKMSLFFAAALEPSEAVLEWVEALPTKAGKRTVEGNLVDALFQLSSLQERVLPLEIAIQNDPELAAFRRSSLAQAGGSLAGPPEAHCTVWDRHDVRCARRSNPAARHRGAGQDVCSRRRATQRVVKATKGSGLAHVVPSLLKPQTRAA
jgi:AcrR family transcriptional regulator